MDKCLASISSLKKTRSPPPYWLRSLQKRVEKLGILNWSVGKEASGSVSDTTKTLTFLVIWLASKSNLFLKELILKWEIMIRFKFSCLITLKVFSDTLFVKSFIPDVRSFLDPYSVWKSLTQLKASKIQNDDRKYFIKLLAKTEFLRLFRWSFIYPKCSFRLLLSIKSRRVCWQ